MYVYKLIKNLKNKTLNRKLNSKKSSIMNLIIDIPKKEKFGEDASPMFMESENKQISIIGVFDGMGGSGSTLYVENEESHTGAYLASRTVKNVVEQFFDEQLKDENFVFSQDKILILKEKIVDGLKSKLNKQHYEQSKIRSSLIRTFPTTIAICIVFHHNTKSTIQTIWAGDSRIYCLSPENGLVQLTKDDLKLDNDPFQNIENDSPLSNMINLDEDFILNFKEVEIQGTSLILAATDGCFGYYSTPIHFENVLLKTMLDSTSIDEWQKRIIDELNKVSGDDFSMSLKCINNKETDFKQLRNLFQNRLEVLYRDFMKDINNIDEIMTRLREKEIALKNEIEQYESKRKKLFEQLWDLYKKTNYSHFKTKA